MTVTRELTCVFDSLHDMFAEGTSDIEPEERDIISLLNIENWNVSNIDIWFDNMMGFWRWSCNIFR